MCTKMKVKCNNCNEENNIWRVRPVSRYDKDKEIFVPLKLEDQNEFFICNECNCADVDETIL